MNKYVIGVALVALLALGGLYQQYRISNLTADVDRVEKENVTLTDKVRETLELNTKLKREAINKDIVIAKERSRADSAQREYTEVTNDINKLAEEDESIAKILSIELPPAIFDRLLVD